MKLKREALKGVMFGHGGLFRSRRGVYELLLGFFLVFVLLFAVLFFLYLNNQTSLIYSTVKGRTNAYEESQNIRSVLMDCHGVTYLDEARMDDPCPAKAMGRGFVVTQLPLNGCAQKRWDFSRGEYSQKVPYIVTVLQNGSGQKCLARLEVLFP